MSGRMIICMVGLVALSVLSTPTEAQVTIDTVAVGNPGNTGELSGYGAGGYGPDRICGAVDYVYRMGKFEITAGQYTAFLNAVADEDTYGLYNTHMDYDANPDYRGCNIKRTGAPGGYTYSVAGDWADRPVNLVSWGDAARFANWLHNGQPTGAQDLNTTEDGSYYLNGAMSSAELMAVVREPDATWVITSEDEWYKAAYHVNDGVTGNYYDYPTSSNVVPSNGLIDPDPGNNANFDASYELDPEDYTIGSPYWRTEVGDFENSESPYGTFDQGGNLAEWNEAVIEVSYRGVRGGSFSYYDYALQAAEREGSYDPTNEPDNVGFRVAYFADCNHNGILDECDLDCGTTAGPCDVPGCGQSTDENGNGVLDDCAPDIPAISQWGIIAMTLLVLTAGTVIIARRRTVASTR